MKVTRPEPTIYGNCDSWSFIVGKTRRAYSLGPRPARPLRVRDALVIHSFSTIFAKVFGNNMWAACGSPGAVRRTYRIVVEGPGDMPQ